MCAKVNWKIKLQPLFPFGHIGIIFFKKNTMNFIQLCIFILTSALFRVHALVVCSLANRMHSQNSLRDRMHPH